MIFQGCLRIKEPQSTFSTGLQTQFIKIFKAIFCISGSDIRSPSQRSSKILQKRKFSQQKSEKNYKYI